MLNELTEFYAAMATRQPVRVAYEQLMVMYEKMRQIGDVKAARLATGDYKKLQDEVHPALIFARCEHPKGEIQFHLSDRGADATVWPRPSSCPILLETTITSGKARYFQMTALNQTGVGHGLTNATDADSFRHVKDQYDKWGAYSPEEVCENLAAAIRLCVEKKSKPAHGSRTLIILATLHTILREEWDSYMPQIGPTLPASPCQAIYVVGRAFGAGEAVCYKLK